VKRLKVWALFLVATVVATLRSKVGAIYAPILGEIRGKLGGVVGSRNKGGPYLRAHAAPTNPNSARQQSTRNQLATASSYWSSTLTDAQRAQWDEWATGHSWKNSLGQDVQLTGLAWFCMVNARLLDSGQSIITAPGDLSAPEGLTTAALTITDATNISIAFTPVLPSGSALVVWGSGPISAGSDPNFRQARLIGYSAVDATTPVAMALPWTLETGDKLKVFVGVLNEKGRVSVMLTDSATKS
jgi:hypothetical protein